MGMLSLQTCIFTPLFISSFLLNQICAHCTGRKILTNSSGTISDGEHDYSNYTRCEWLINAGSANKFILLEFTSMETECSYDFVMVYDGNSHNSTVLGTFSGNTLPRPVLASSGSMLVYIFSDRNYNRAGFTAQYSIQDCPYSCHNHGSCVNHTCVCDKSYTGQTCQKKTCPDSCNLHGHCQQTGCDCFPGFIGDSCNLYIERSDEDVRWYNLSESSQNFTSRFGHSGAFIKSVNCIYVYGGYSLHETFGDVVRYCLNSSSWEIAIQSNPWPPPRKKHASVAVEDGFYIVGGVLGNGSFSSDLWYFDVNTSEWTQKATNSSMSLPNLMDHTLTYANGWLYVIGGKNHEGLFSSDIFRINTTYCDSWEKVFVSGDRQQSRMVSGHTAVFHEVANSILVYGGYRSSYSKYVELSNDIYLLNLNNHIWSHVENKQNLYLHHGGVVDRIPHKRAHHTSVIIGNYMIVYGGNIHIHQNLETCYDNEMFLYHLGCHKWVNHPLFRDVDNTMGIRRYGHVAVSVYGNIMMIIGGYSGSVIGDVMAFKFPPTIALSEFEPDDETDYCMQYTDQHVNGFDATACKEDVECVLCIVRKDISRTGCVHRTRKEEMCIATKEYESSECPGICSSLSSCEACLGNGQAVTKTTNSPTKRVYQEECSWCVKSATCQKTSDPRGVCLSEIDTESGVEGWWNGTSPSWTSLRQCSSNDYQAGIQMIYYYYPQNLHQPDYVVYLNKFQVDIKRVLPYHGNIEKLGNEIKVRITGYIHPLNAPLSYGTETLQLHLKESGDLEVTLNLSNDSSVKNQEIVIHQKTYKKNVPSTVKANRSPVFPYRDRGYKYYFAIEAERSVKEGNAELELIWNVPEGGLMHNDGLHPISMEFLEPYNSIQRMNCVILSNCLACMTDASCAWCSSSLSCFYKGDNSSCLETIPITNPMQCNLCHEHPDCYSCVSNALCEWSVDFERCIRRGRKPQHARTIAECPVPCFQRKTCSSCVVKDKDECFWCENTQECFPFAHYISHHISGQCQEWVDSEDITNNHTCRDCSYYMSCETCLGRHGCGWCGNVDNRLIGRCVGGDFSGPANNQTCPVIVAEEGKDKNVTIDDPAAWMYDKCLDVDECALGIYECDKNAYCENTDVSYECKCKRGYIQEGKSCQKTCFHECINGRCGSDYACVCDLGWTGDNCSTDCQCNNQSMCSKGVGSCDRCHHNTGGTFCQLCLPGFYGVPATGCTACDCNGHGDDPQGHCDSDTGECYCTDDTEGDNCEHCQDGFYGDARNGGTCYRNCDSRVLLDQTTGSFGSYSGAGVTENRTYCVWIIYDKDMDQVSGDQRLMVDMDISVTLTIDNMMLQCGKEHVYVYEGIPSFVYGTETPITKRGLLASFCGEESPRSVTAKSRIMTVYFETDYTVSGFNASYQVNNCDKNCYYQQNRVCKGNQCVCDVGFTGDNCQEFICSQGCTYIYNEDSHSCKCTSSIGDIGILPWYTSLTAGVRRPEDVARGRYGHTLVSVGKDILYMFGGYSLKNEFLNDLWQFNTSSRKWTQIFPFTTTEPSGRFFHTAVYLDYLKTMYVFGGFVKGENGKVQATNEMWKLAIGAHKWTVEQSLLVEAVAGHTMTKIGDAKLLIIGGFSRENYFSEHMYEYDASNSHWRNYSHNDQIGAPIGIYGHTAIYHQETNTVYIYGGMLYKNREIKQSAQLLAFDLKQQHWNTLEPSEEEISLEWLHVKELTRIFHTAVDAGKYMIIFGGQSGSHGNTALVYNYRCNNWFQVNITGSNITFMMSAAAMYRSPDDNESPVVYILGGYDGMVHSHLINLTLPVDSCRLITDKYTCTKTVGCKGCLFNNTTGEIQTSCFSESMNEFLPSECFPKSVLIPGLGECDLGWYRNRPCNRYTTCDSCLSVHPHFKEHNDGKGCRWCTGCSEEKCIQPDKQHCSAPCTSVQWCGINECSSGTCHKCHALNCEWTNETESNPYKGPFYFDTGKGKALNHLPSGTSKGQWHCRPKQVQDGQCGKPCHHINKCSACISSGAEGASSTCVWSQAYQEVCNKCSACISHEGASSTCVWSQAYQECMPKASVDLLCYHGNCGLVLEHQDRRNFTCPKPCKEYTQCSHCLNTPGCGWCAGHNGEGICMEGGIIKPSEGTCSELDNKQHHIFPTSKFNRLGTWKYMSCPPENECENGHHTCNPNTQDCQDTLEGFTCKCKNGYRLESGECKPICHQGCIHGRCVQPDICQCNFSYVGNSCEEMCDCNMNSECASKENKRHCLRCENNTQGAQCGHCKMWYVGNPRQGVSCKSCFNVCHNHTARCSSVKDYHKLVATTIYSTYDYDKVIPDFNPNGPTDNPICIRCQNNTEGRLCDVCQEGYFRMKNRNTPFDACVECQCHGHSSKCNNVTGECRPCHNNTKTTCSSDGDSMDKCWTQQCAACDEYFQGWPVHNHHCYRQVTVDREYCLDPDTQNECNQNPQPLLPGRTVFFCVQPRYLNVDIRITIDILQGGADIFLSPNDQTFTVKVDRETGEHVLKLDENLQNFSNNIRRWKWRKTKRSLPLNNINLHSIMPDVEEELEDKVRNTTSGVVYRLMDIQAQDYHTYYTINKANTILTVKNVESRLVITIPVQSHNLRTAKFFMVMYGVGGSGGNSTYGNLYFRQDQPHIDLFVFFSVFFSSFFLFLAICVLLWKMKQAVDTQRSRQQRAKEMMHMASRPFSKVLVYIEPEPVIMSSTPILRRQKLPKIPNRNNVPIMGLPPVEILPPIVHTTMTIKEIVPFDVIPIALEPISTGSAAIRTVVIQLPGGSSTTSKLCLGSTLTMNYRQTNSGPKGQARRRPSASTC